MLIIKTTLLLVITASVNSCYVYVRVDAIKYQFVVEPNTVIDNLVRPILFHTVKKVVN